MPGANRLYATCPGVPEVAVYDISTPANFTAGTIADISTAGVPASVAIQSDNSHAFVTLNGLDQLFVIDNTAAPTPVMSSPRLSRRQPQIICSFSS